MRDFHNPSETNPRGQGPSRTYQGNNTFNSRDLLPNGVPYIIPVHREGVSSGSNYRGDYKSNFSRESFAGNRYEDSGSSNKSINYDFNTSNSFQNRENYYNPQNSRSYDSQSSEELRYGASLRRDLHSNQRSHHTQADHKARLHDDYSRDGYNGKTVAQFSSFHTTQHHSSHIDRDNYANPIDSPLSSRREGNSNNTINSNNNRAPFPDRNDNFISEDRAPRHPRVFFDASSLDSFDSESERRATTPERPRFDSYQTRDRPGDQPSADHRFPRATDYPSRYPDSNHSSSRSSYEDPFVKSLKRRAESDDYNRSIRPRNSVRTRSLSPPPIRSEAYDRLPQRSFDAPISRYGKTTYYRPDERRPAYGSRDFLPRVLYRDSDYLHQPLPLPRIDRYGPRILGRDSYHPPSSRELPPRPSHYRGHAPTTTTTDYRAIENSRERRDLPPPRAIDYRRDERSNRLRDSLRASDSRREPSSNKVSEFNEDETQREANISENETERVQKDEFLDERVKGDFNRQEEATEEYQRNPQDKGQYYHALEKHQGEQEREYENTPPEENNSAERYFPHVENVEQGNGDSRTQEQRDHGDEKLGGDSSSQ